MKYALRYRTAKPLIILDFQLASPIGTIRKAALLMLGGCEKPAGTINDAEDRYAG